MNLSLFIPAYNASLFIENVIRRIPDDVRQWISHIYIINDGSIDATAAVINELAKHDTTIVPIHFADNSGYGAAVKEGLRHCKTNGCDYALCLHADGQYPPEQIASGVERMAHAGLDIMQGSRIASGTALSGGMPLYKFIANRMLTRLENIVFGLRMTDYHSGMLFYSRKALDTLPFCTFSNSFDFDVEVIACSRARNLAVGEMPIPTHYGEELSHVRSIPYGFRVLRVVFDYIRGKYSQV